MSDIDKLYEALDKTSQYNKMGGRGNGDLSDTCYVCGISPTNLKSAISTAVREARIDELNNWRVFLGANKVIVQEIDERLAQLKEGTIE